MTVITKMFKFFNSNIPNNKGTKQNKNKCTNDFNDISTNVEDTEIIEGTQDLENVEDIFRHFHRKLMIKHKKHIRSQTNFPYVSYENISIDQLLCSNLNKLENARLELKDKKGEQYQIFLSKLNGPSLIIRKKLSVDNYNIESLIRKYQPQIINLTQNINNLIKTKIKVYENNSIISTNIEKMRPDYRWNNKYFSAKGPIDLNRNKSEVTLSTTIYLTNNLKNHPDYKDTRRKSLGLGLRNFWNWYKTNKKINPKQNHTKLKSNFLNHQIDYLKQGMLCLINSIKRQGLDITNVDYVNFKDFTKYDLIQSDLPKDKLVDDIKYFFDDDHHKFDSNYERIADKTDYQTIDNQEIINISDIIQKPYTEKPIDSKTTYISNKHEIPDNVTQIHKHPNYVFNKPK